MIISPVPFIENIAEDLQKQILEQVMGCQRFSIQLEESTGVPNMSRLMLFARFLKL